jgi:hypothetical protein
MTPWQTLAGRRQASSRPADFGNAGVLPLHSGE